MSHLLNIAVRGLDLDAETSPPPNNDEASNSMLLQYHSPPSEQEQAFLCRSQSIKLRNPKRNHHRTRRSGGRSSLAFQRRPSVYAPMRLSPTFNGGTMDEKEEVRDDHDTFTTCCEDDDPCVPYDNQRQERLDLLRALASKCENGEEQGEEAKKEDVMQFKGNVQHDASIRPVFSRSHSMDPGLLRGGRGREEDQGEEQPSHKAAAVLRRSQSLDHGRRRRRGSQNNSNNKKKTKSNRKRAKVPKVSSISSVDTIMMESDIWIECLWFKKTKNKSSHKRTATRRKKTYFKSFRTQRCFKRPPDGARTVLYLETFSDSDEDYYYSSSSSSGSGSTTICFGEQVDDCYDSDCGDSMDCLYQDYTIQREKQECCPMKVPGVIVPVIKARSMKKKKKMMTSTTKTQRRIRKRWRALIRLFSVVKPTKGSF